MFPSLTNALEGNGVEDSLRTDHFCMITDTPYVSANSLVNYFLVKSVKDKNVIFFALQNTWSHYCNIGNKLGVNLRKMSEDGSVYVGEPLKMLPDILSEKNIEDNLFNFVIHDKAEPLRDFYFYLKNKVEMFKKKNSKPISIIIDNITPLLDMGIEVKDVEIFIQYCLKLVPNPQDLLVISCSVDEKTHSVTNILTKRLFHKTSTILGVKGLSTGTSKHIHGELNIYTIPDNKFSGLRKHQQFHFKIEDKDVKIFSPGLASSIL